MMKDKGLTKELEKPAQLAIEPPEEKDTFITGTRMDELRNARNGLKKK